MKTEIAFILDRSGSMASIRSDAIGGFNTFIDEQKKLPGAARFSLIQFDHRYQIVHNSIDLLDVPPLTEQTFVPDGWTALHDAIGRTVMDINARTSPDDKVIIAILTDGAENKSREFSGAQVKSMLEEKQAQGWTVIFLGANQDAFAVGSSLGVLRGSTYQFAATAQGTTQAYADISKSVSSARLGPI